MLEAAGLWLLLIADLTQSMLFSPRRLETSWPSELTLEAMLLKSAPAVLSLLTVRVFGFMTKWQVYLNLTILTGQSKSLPEGQEVTHSENGVEIFKLFKWGSTVNVYSFLRVWVSTDNTFVQVMPAPSTRGQHCGLCGTFNRNVYDEWMGKDGVTMKSSAAEMVNEWKWQC